MGTRADVYPDALPFEEHLTGMHTFIYYHSSYILDGPRALDRRKITLLYTMSLHRRCHHFAAVDFLRGMRNAELLKRVVLADKAVPCRTVRRLVERLVRHGVLDIPVQNENYVIARHTDFIGVKFDDQENWYALLGPIHHRDERHYKKILPIFWGKWGLEPYENQLAWNDLDPAQAS